MQLREGTGAFVVAIYFGRCEQDLNAGPHADTPVLACAVPFPVHSLIYFHLQGESFVLVPLILRSSPTVPVSKVIASHNRGTLAVARPMLHVRPGEIHPRAKLALVTICIDSLQGLHVLWVVHAGNSPASIEKLK